jgi:lactoylglutathione lyase
MWANFNSGKPCMKKLISILLLIIIFDASKAQEKYASFNHIAIEVRNLDQSTAFYSKLFHFDTIPSPWPNRRIRWFKIGEHDQLHVIEADSGEKIITAENFHFCFSVRSIAEFIIVLKNEHISYNNGYGKPNEMTMRADGVKQIYIKDPDGYLVEINDQVY